VEWEYAARSGGINAAEEFAGGKNLSEVANICGQTIDVASKQPNNWGLYDMSGNVAEWCEDWWENYATKGKTAQGQKAFFFKIVRGGSYNDGGNRDKLRCYYRGKQKPDNALPNIGFRLAQDN
jgi:formylglycine-generating enzyme required for sulfatase activity